MARSIILVAFLALTSSVFAQSKSCSLSVSVPGTIARGHSFNISATLRDAWTNQPLAGRMMLVSVGAEWWLTDTGWFNTNGGGTASRTWTFPSNSTPGRYRVVCYVVDAYGYLSQRTTAFIQVT